jgi:FlaA1/EpsC-like NDP-sugar epimerase
MHNGISIFIAGRTGSFGRQIIRDALVRVWLPA